MVARRATRDCPVAFEGRRYRVPFAWVGRTLEVRGTVRHTVIHADGCEVARHQRHIARRLVLEDTHYEEPSTRTVLVPVPLGIRVRLQLEAIPEARQLTRPLSEYLTLLAEASR